MNELTLKTLTQILINNLGNKLTVELANGIVTSLAQALPKETPSTPVESDAL